ncbi:MAG: hypothetical protein ABI231_09965 [Candidatus Tumulicola sp.]
MPNKTVAVNLHVSGIAHGEPHPKVRAYLFSQSGRLIDSKPTRGDAIAFEIDPDRAYRVTIGPDLIANEKAPADLARQLRTSGSLSQDVSPNSPHDAIDFRVYPPIWRCWLPTCINVHGTVRKLINPGAPDAQYAPLCQGTVQIFQVDLEGTLDSFSVIDFELLKTKLVSKFAMASAQSTTAITLAALNDLPLKQYIVANKELFWPFWCELIPDSAFTWQLLTQVPIQSDGTFNSEICFWCPADYPDIYFEVVQNIDGNPVEVWDAQIACNTYYNYDGSQSADIVISDPRAIACLPQPNPGPDYLYVWPTAIGNVDLGEIVGLEDGIAAPPGAIVGCLLEGSDNWAWGGTLCLQMQFHPDLQANNIAYYRWSYRFADEANFTPVTASVTHRYQTLVSVWPDIVIHLNPVTFGPQTVGSTPNLFAIPDATLDWIDIDDPADRPFAYFDSTENVTPGKSGPCTLMLELFDAAGNFVPCNNARGSSTDGDLGTDPGGAGGFTYILPEIGSPGTYTNAPAYNVTDHGRLTFEVLVDNRQTVAELPRVLTPTDSTDSNPCGVLHYSNLSDNVEIDYVAYQPGNFIYWGLSVVRGTSGQVAALDGDANAGSPGFPDAFNNTAGALLGTCVQGAFAVNLDTYPRITSGYSQQTQYDDSATVAFALLTM